MCSTKTMQAHTSTYNTVLLVILACPTWENKLLQLPFHKAPPNTSQQPVVTPLQRDSSCFVLHTPHNTHFGLKQKLVGVALVTGVPFYYTDTCTWRGLGALTGWSKGDLQSLVFISGVQDSCVPPWSRGGILKMQSSSKCNYEGTSGMQYVIVIGHSGS